MLLLSSLEQIGCKVANLANFCRYIYKALTAHICHNFSAPERFCSKFY